MDHDSDSPVIHMNAICVRFGVFVDIEKLKLELSSTVSTYDRVKIATQWILENSDKVVDSDNPMKSDDIVDLIYNKYELMIGLQPKSFKAYLSRVATGADTAITSAGRGKGGGYYLVDMALEEREVEGTPVQIEESTPTESGKLGNVQREKLLYPALTQWLLGQGYGAQDTSAMKSLGKWGNPDITGLKVNEHLGTINLEIATIEAKISLSDWERFFFEAVSHRRFASRAYFAYAHPVSQQNKMPVDMRYYSELYGVGVLSITMSDEEFDDLLKGRSPSIDIDSSDVVEVLSAPRFVVPIEYQRVFCEALAVKDLQGLMRWGAQE
jgi:hypothetical protein